MITKRMPAITILLLLVMPVSVVKAMPIPGLEDRALLEQIRAIQALRRCEAEAGDTLQLCVQNVLDEKTFIHDELSESIRICDDEYLHAIARCREHLAQPTSVIKREEQVGDFLG